MTKFNIVNCDFALFVIPTVVMRDNQRVTYSYLILITQFITLSYRKVKMREMCVSFIHLPLQFLQSK